VKALLRGTFFGQSIGGLALAVVALGTVMAGGAKADCGPGQAGRVQAGFPAPAFMPVQYTAADRNAADTRDADSSSVSGSIVGMWNITFTSGGQVVDQGFDVWHSDGTEILNDNPPPSSGNVCLGVWQQTGRFSFKLKHPSWTYDNNGNLTGIATIREQITLDPSGNTFKGTFTVDVADLNGNALLHIAGTVSAKRITVD
jgi:hypothetical protein